MTTTPLHYNRYEIRWLTLIKKSTIGKLVNTERWEATYKCQQPLLCLIVLMFGWPNYSEWPVGTDSHLQYDLEHDVMNKNMTSFVWLQDPSRSISCFSLLLVSMGGSKEEAGFLGYVSFSLQPPTSSPFWWDWPYQIAEVKGKKYVGIDASVRQ